MINGIKRGLFSNEAGMGSASKQRYLVTPYCHTQHLRGMYRCLVYLWIPVICSATVAIILMSGEYVPHGEITGMS